MTEKKSGRRLVWFIYWFILLFLFGGGVYTNYFDADFHGKYSKDPVRAALIAEGKQLYEKRECATCHGKGGKNPSDDVYPRINNQQSDYIATQITDIKSGRRNNGMSGVMRTAIENVDESEIRVIAAYLESIK